MRSPALEIAFVLSHGGMIHAALPIHFLLVRGSAPRKDSRFQIRLGDVAWVSPQQACWSDFG